MVGGQSRARAERPEGTTKPKAQPCLTLGNENKLAVSPVWCHPLLSCWSRSCLHHGVGSVQCH